jgi:hypothetical protein
MVEGAARWLDLWSSSRLEVGGDVYLCHRVPTWLPRVHG